MRYRLFALPYAVMLVLSACASSTTGPEVIRDGFLTPDAAGMFPLSLTDVHAGSVAGAYAYQLGFQQDVGLRVFAGLMPDAKVSGLPAGDMIFDATFEGTVTEDIRILPPPVPAGDPLLAGTNRRFSGDIILTVATDGSRMSGVGDGLGVAADLDGQSMTGTVTYAGVTGLLDGLAGADRALGAFYGIADETVFSGGFAGTAQ